MGFYCDFLSDIYIRDRTVYFPVEFHNIAVRQEDHALQIQGP